MSAETVVVPRIFHICEVPDLSSESAPQRLKYLFWKRCLDIAAAIMLLVITAPVILIAAILIRLESKGPAFYLQKRVGAKYRRKKGHIVWQIRLFRCYKLRTMRTDSDPAIHKEYLRRFREGKIDLGPKHAPFKLNRDARITRVGRWLRKTSLDELPQLINVIKGDMSLVGPRPVPIYEVELYDRQHYNRLAARPGITGIWQVYGRSRVTFDEMIEMDAEYVRQSSMWLDIKLLLLTVTSVVSFKGAA